MIWEQILERVHAYYDDIAVIEHEGRRWTFGQLAELATVLSNQLPAPNRGLPCRILVRQREPFATFVSVLACWRAGCVPVVLRASMPEEQVADLAKWLRPAGVLSGPLPNQPRVGSQRTFGSRFEPREEGLVICTSGTTGPPKLVALPAESVCLNAAVIATSLGLKAGEVVAVNTPLGYMYGLMGGCMAALWAGAVSHLFGPLEPLTQLQAAIRRGDASVVQGPPSLFRLFMAYWNREPFSSVRVVTTGGEPMTGELRSLLGEAFPESRRLFLYGMTEAGPRLSHLAFEAGGGIEGRVGMPYPHIEWRIVPVPESEPHGLVGRLALRGPSLFLGYITRTGGYSGLAEDNFFETNDLVSLDCVDSMRFMGRIDRIFRSGGRLVSPEAVERVLSLHPSVQDANCFPRPHPILGLVPVAEVVTKPGMPFEPMELLEWCRYRIEGHAVPRLIKAIADEGVGESGKRLRRT